MNRSTTMWAEDNQRELVAALAEVRSVLEGGVEESGAAHPAALEVLCEAFSLSRFERAVLLLCAGVELDSQFGRLCAQANGDQSRGYATFSLCLGALKEPHWSALSPAGPLRRWRLVEVSPGGALTTAPLRIDERILHYLTGLQVLDERLQSVLEPVFGEDLTPSQEAQAGLVAEAWSTEEWAPAGQPLPVIQLYSGDEATRRMVAAAGCARLGLRAYGVAAENLPQGAAELETFTRLWEREAVLEPCALYVDAEQIERSDARTMAQVCRILERTSGPMIISARDRWRPLRRAMRAIEVVKPTGAEQCAVWERSLVEMGMTPNGAPSQLASQFNLSVPAIRASVREATAAKNTGTLEGLWEAGRSQARPRLEDLAQRIRASAWWDDLVLPQSEKRALEEITFHVRERAKVYDQWGLGAASGRGLGISAMFAGASGTGKTMAAEVLSNELRLDLYRIDLASVVSKYIGETEKNLRRVFDAAEEGGAILFFDEADALFGKRTEVKDSHDRYANIEVSYLLQRMEGYRGLSVLATNAKGSIDTAFLRRIRFVINFPFPDAGLRAEIWQRVFPAPTPVEGLDIAKLARLNVPGGNIRNIALQGAFLAAAEGGPIRMGHLLQAARREYGKIEKPLTDAEIGGWE